MMTINGKDCTPKTVIRYVLCSVLEDLENNFHEYAKTCLKDDYSAFDDNDKAKLDEWKRKVFAQLNKYLAKDDFNEN